MASTSGCSHELNDLRLSDIASIMVDSSEKSNVAIATHGSDVDHATTSTSYFSAVEEQIERSKAHWSTLADPSGCIDEDEVNFKVSNKQEFLDLQGHPTWGSFFANFTGDGISTGINYDDLGELVVGKKFAEGGQAELYEAQVKWNDPTDVERSLRYKLGWVLKVFKEGTSLKHVKSQLPEGLLRVHVKSWKKRYHDFIPDRTSQIRCGILLNDGRFAFLIKREHYDLRTLIERNIKLRSGEDCGPFSKEDVELLMYFVALGVELLHGQDIVHRDLKASNVLIHELYDDGYPPRWNCLVADYECSIGVVGTTFFRAPEILQACKERKVNERPYVFSRAADVYSYGMICYEILTGKLPFEDHPLSHSPSLLMDLVMNQHLRREVPLYVEDWARKLLSGCWQFDSTTRPSIREILNVLLANSAEVRRVELNF